MRKTLSTLVMGLLFVTLAFQSQAQNQTYKWGIGTHFVLMDRYTFNDDFSRGLLYQPTFTDFDPGLRLSINRFINPSLDFQLPMTFAQPDVLVDSNNTKFDRKYFDAAAKLKLKMNNDVILKQDARIGPYLFAGIGLYLFDSASEYTAVPIVPLGAGFNFRVDDRTSVQFQSAYKMKLSEETGVAYNVADLHHSLGLVYNFNLGRKAAEDLAKSASDIDKDGILDDVDRCPYLPGVEEFNGCPDTDGDGLADIDDDCPTEPGTRENRGCPIQDRDRDGVADKVDDCPDVFGSASLKGCPDTDGDGIADNVDGCPKVAGAASNNGCPPATSIPAFSNTASSTTLNWSGDCADVQGLFSAAQRNVEFDYNRARLRSVSYSTMDEIVNFMRSCSSARLAIDGHTDNHGSNEYNRTLSQKRVNAVKDYLVSKGIDGSRISATGYGEDRPVAANQNPDGSDNPSGRQLNRRVEFHLR